jgi:uncharacterized protein (TIGR03437 family)
MTPLLLLASALVATPQVPLYFEPNAGQAEEGVRFLGRGRGYTLSLRPDGTALRLRNGAGLSWKAVGSAGCGQLEAEEALPGKSSYFIGNDPSRWVSGVPQFGAVRCRGLYDGIDVVYRGDARGLEYDFVVAPRADPARIALEFGGASSVSIDRAGDLVLRSGVSEIRHHKPAIYQELNGVRAPVQGSFVRKGRRRVGFHVAAYDRARPLIIDPVLTYSTYLGSFNEDAGLGVAVDSQGNIFVAGSTKGIDFPGARGNTNGGLDIFVAKFSPAGALLRSVHIGGSADDEARAIAVDSTGAAYITGSTKSSNFPFTTGVFQVVYGGGATDAFVTKLNASDLSIVYSTFLGGGRDDTGNGIAVDSGGNAYVAGGTTSNNLPIVLQSYQPTKSDSTLSGFVTKVNPSATQLVYSTYILGVQTAEVRGIAVDSGGLAHLAGATQAGLVGSTAICNQDAFYLKLNAAGTQAIFSTCLGGRLADEANAIAVDSAGSAYLAGSTASFDFPQVPVKLRCGNFTDAFVAKISAEGTTVYSACLGGSNVDTATGVAVDARGIVYFTGATESRDFPVTADAVQSNLVGPPDAFVASADPAGTVLLSSTYLGGAGLDRGAAIAIDARLSAVVVGTTSSQNFPVTSDAFQPRMNGGIGGVDAFLARLQFPLNYPRLSAGGIVNGASFQSGPVAAGSQVSLFGVDLATAEYGAKVVPLPLELIGTAVLINDRPVPLFYVAPNQVNIQLRPDMQAGEATAVVTLAGVPSAPQTFTVAPAAPGLYVVGNHALAQNQDWSTNTPQTPAEAGSVVVVYLTGIGQTDIPTEAGQPAPPDLARAVLPYSATIGGQQAEVQFLGLTPGLIGTAQANLRVPNLPAGEYPVQITVGGAKSNTPVLSVK